LTPRFVWLAHAYVTVRRARVPSVVAVFAVDLINLFYISLLGHQEIAAAVGFAGVVGFSPVSAIGLTIGIGAVVARAIGAASADARRPATPA
jgi:Na+-driven multidrug efflux pump